MSRLEFPPEIVERVMGRRGRLHASTALDAARTALLVVDLQVHFMAEGSSSEVPAARAIVPTVNRLANALREKGGRVVWVVSTYGPDPAGRWSNLFDHVLGPEAARRFQEGLSEGSAGHALWPELDRRPEEPVVAKNRFGAFAGSAGRLERLLRDRDLDTVLVAGTVTEVCCESTAREAATLDFRTVMVCDAIAGRSEAADLHTYAVFLTSYGDVMSAGEVIERLS